MDNDRPTHWESIIKMTPRQCRSSVSQIATAKTTECRTDWHQIQDDPWMEFWVSCEISQYENFREWSHVLFPTVPYQWSRNDHRTRTSNQNCFRLCLREIQGDAKLLRASRRHSEMICHHWCPQLRESNKSLVAICYVSQRMHLARNSFQNLHRRNTSKIAINQRCWPKHCHTNGNGQRENSYLGCLGSSCYCNRLKQMCRVFCRNQTKTGLDEIFEKYRYRQ